MTVPRRGRLGRRLPAMPPTSRPLPATTTLLVAAAALGGRLGSAAEVGTPRLDNLMAHVALRSPAHIQGSSAGLFATFSAVPGPMDDGAITLVPASGDEGCSPYEAPRGGKPAVAVVRRGTCTFERKALLAQEAGARGIIVVMDSEEVFVMNGENDTGEVVPLQVFAVGMQKSFGDKIFAWDGAHPSEESVVVSVEAYVMPLWNWSEVVIVFLATALVVAGAHFATADLRSGSPIAPKREEVMEVSSEMAFGFCAMGSIMLMVLFFFMAYMIYVIILCFCIGSASCIMHLVSAYLQYVAPGTRQPVTTLPEVGVVTRADLLAAVPATLLVLGWLLFRNTEYGWLFQDVLGAAFLCMLQRTLRLPNMKVATLLLSVMFAFDIFWVFISPWIFQKSVMVEVARGGGTGEAVPMLLRVPSVGDPLGRDRMLGFGDVALPGLLVSYLLRHDTLSKRRRLVDGYFAPSVVGYFVGLVATIVSLVVMRKGQPALLYLVPGTLGTTLALAVRRRELGNLWDGSPSVDGATSFDSKKSGGPQVVGIAAGEMACCGEDDCL